MYLGGIVLFILMLMTIVCCVEYIMVKKEFDKIEFEIERVKRKFLLIQYSEIVPRSLNEHSPYDWMILGTKKEKKEFDVIKVG